MKYNLLHQELEHGRNRVWVVSAKAQNATFQVAIRKLFVPFQLKK